MESGRPSHKALFCSVASPRSLDSQPVGLIIASLCTRLRSCACLDATGSRRRRLLGGAFGLDLSDGRLRPPRAFDVPLNNRKGKAQSCGSVPRTCCWRERYGSRSERTPTSSCRSGRATGMEAEDWPVSVHCPDFVCLFLSSFFFYIYIMKVLIAANHQLSLPPLPQCDLLVSSMSASFPVPLTHRADSAAAV